MKIFRHVSIILPIHAQVIADEDPQSIAILDKVFFTKQLEIVGQANNDLNGLC